MTEEPDEAGGVSPWRGTGPELTIAAAGVAAAAGRRRGRRLARPGGGGDRRRRGHGMVVLRALLPRAAAHGPARQGQAGRAPIFGYAQRRFVVASSLSAAGAYESDLRPVLEHLLAARLAENHGINLYTEPAAARRAFCRARGDEALWSLVDPQQTLFRTAQRRQAAARHLAPHASPAGQPIGATVTPEETARQAAAILDELEKAVVGKPPDPGAGPDRHPGRRPRAARRPARAG